MSHSQEQPPEEFQQLLEAFQKAQEGSDVEEMEALGVQGLLMAAEWAEGREDESLRLQQEAHEHEAAAAWERAETCYRRVLEIAEGEGNPMGCYKAHSDLSALYDLLGQADRAVAEAQLALAAARQSELVPLIALALEKVGYHLLDHGDSDGARHAAEEVLGLCETEPMFDMHRARGWILRARCSIALGDCASARQDLETAWPLLEPYQEATFMAGYQSSLAAWWTATASLREREGECMAALEATERVMGLRRTIGELPQLAGPYAVSRLAKSLCRYATLLAAAGKEQEALGAIEESRTYRAAIGLAPL